MPEESRTPDVVELVRRYFAALNRPWVYEWMDDLIVGLTLYLDPDDARAAAERLAEGPG
jgi:hypothetical protein